MTIEEKIEALFHLAELHANAIADHDRQIEALIKISEQNAHEWQALREDMRGLVREWQAYLRRIPTN